MKKNINLIFIGTSDFGLPSLKSLLKDKNFNISLIITQPDKKTGRKQSFSYPPVKEEALKNNLAFLQPEKIISIKKEIEKIKPDIMLVAAYAQIIPEEIFNLPKYGCLNIHGSLLPKYRGAACVQAPILKGDKHSGITVIKIDKGLDTGDIVWQKAIPLDAKETYKTLFNKLSDLAGENINRVISSYLQNKIEVKKQTDKNSSYVKILKKTDGHINFNKPAKEIERFVRAMNPWPGAFVLLNNKKIKIIEVDNNILNINEYKEGRVFQHKSLLAIQTYQGSLIVKKLQIEGKKSMSAADFINGNRIVNQLLE